MNAIIRFFVRGNTTDDLAAYCGDVNDLDAAVIGASHIIRAEMEELIRFAGSEESVEITLIAKAMSDAEVKELPVV